MQIGRTDLFFDGDGCSWIGSWSDARSVLGRHAELVHHVLLQAFHRVRRLGDLVVGRSDPLHSALDAMFHHVVGDVGAAVGLGRLPRQTRSVLERLDDLQRQRLAWLLCNVRIAQIIVK